MPKVTLTVAGFVCALLLTSVSLTACAPDVGSEKWCAQLDAKVKGEWTINEAKDYAKHCLFNGK